MAKQLVIPFACFNRMDAHNYAKSLLKRLASHRLLDEGIMAGKITCICYAREFIAYPASKGRFPRNEDVFDSASNIIVPITGLARALNEDMDEVYEEGRGLLIDPGDLDTCRKTGSMVVIPESVAILGNSENPFIQEGNRWVKGRLDTESRIPLAVSEEEWNGLPDEEKRFFYRVSQQGIRPIVRDSRNFGCGDRRNVAGNALPNVVFGVVFEEEVRTSGISQPAWYLRQ